MRCFDYDIVDSTNARARRLWAGGQALPLCVVAREQTAGRGTRGRTWISPRDAGLYLSVVEPGSRLARMDAGHATLAAGVACARVLREISGLEVRLRAVNDLYLDGGKLGGILSEALISGGRPLALITGIGINLARAERLLPGGAAAVCLEDALPPARFRAVTLGRLRERLLVEILAWHRRAACGEFEAVRAAAEQLRGRREPLRAGLAV